METDYSVQYSTTKWPSDKYEGYLFSSLSHVPIVADVLVEGVEQTLKNVVKLQFTFEELNTQTITESPKYTELDLFSNIGGLLGLYVGVSIVTVFEMLDYLVEMLLHLCLWGRIKKRGHDLSNERLGTPGKVNPTFH